MMLVWEIGASYGLTLFRSDFIDYMECNITVKDMTKVNRVIGIVTTLHKVIYINGQDIFLPCIFNIPTQTDVCPFSPQTCHQMHCVHYVVHGNQVTTHLSFHRTHIHVDLCRINLPVFHNSFVTEYQKRKIGPQMRLSLDYSRL